MTSVRSLCLTLALLATPVAWSYAHAAETPSAGQVDAEHARLGAIAGHWSVTQSVWEWKKPTAAPQVDHGTAVFGMVLDGRHLRQDLHIDSAKPFDGIGYMGFDNEMGEYYTSWMDVGFPGMVVAQGQFDPAARTYTFKGTMADGHTVGKRIPLREVMRMVDDDHFVYEYYEDHGSGDVLTVRLEYARKS